MRTVAACMVPLVGALQGIPAVLLQQNGRGAVLSMQMEGMPSIPGLEGMPNPFAEEPPPSWGSPEWSWGSADGEAHTVAARVRDELGKRHRRTALLSYAKMGAVDFFDLKMALALKCQKARNEGYDAPDGRWEQLMDAMAACEFEEDNLIDQQKLADAVNTRLASGPIEAIDIDGSPNPAGIIAAALEELDFVEKGL